MVIYLFIILLLTNNNDCQFQANEKEKTKTKLSPAAWVMFGSLVIDLIGFTVILPLMPKLLDHYSITGGSSISFLESTVKRLQETFDIPDKFNSVMTGGLLFYIIYIFFQFILFYMYIC